MHNSVVSGTLKNNMFSSLYQALKLNLRLFKNPGSISKPKKYKLDTSRMRRYNRIVSKRGMINEYLWKLNSEYFE